MPPSHKRGVFRTFVHRKKTSPREVESLYHKKSPLVNSCGRFFRIFRRPAEERRGGRENLCFAEERRGERENLCPAEERRAGRENLRRDTPPMSPAAQRRERRMPQVPADAFLPRAKGRTAKSLRPAAAAPGLPSHIFLLTRRRSAQPCLSTASDTQSRPLSFRMQYLYARCAASHLLPLSRAASIAPLRR